jgi:hypothetical protein
MDVFNKRLRDEILALRKSIDAIRDQQERHYQEQQAERKLPQPPIGVETETHERPDAERESTSYRKNTLRVQWVTALATSLAFIAAAIYAGIASRQLTNSQNQLTTSQQQTALLLKQTEVLEAIVKANPGMQIESGLMEFGFMNIGRLPASNVCAALIISKRKLPSEQLEGSGTPWNPCVAGELAPSPGEWDPHETEFYISPAELKRIQKTELTIRMEGIVTYNDGFVEKEPPCLYKLAPGSNQRCGH